MLSLEDVSTQVKMRVKYLGPREKNMFLLNGGLIDAFENTLSTL